MGSSTIITRKSVVLDEPESRGRKPLLLEEECTVLVINASQDMAKEITLQLTLKIPGCSIMYAPSLELAKWMLKRRKIHLIVSSSILPDGSITALQGILHSMKSPPDLVVVGDLKVQSAELFESNGYEFAALRRFGRAAEQPASRQIPLINQRIKNLGADIRNDLNNPLQEIVAMVFVAQAGAETSPATNMALDAIDNAAKNMAKVVNDLENKIRDVVVKPSAA